MSAERLPFDELFLKEKLKSEPTTWETRRQLAQGLYDKQAYVEAAEIIWTTDHIPNTDIDLAFAIRVLAKAQPRRSIRLLTAVLELNQGKAVQNMAMANALLHHGMVLQAARFYGAALEADPTLVNPDLEHFLLWSDDESTMWGLFENKRPKLGELPWMVRDPKEALRLTSRVSLHTTPIYVPELPIVAGEHLKHELYQQEASHNAKITPPPAVTIPIDRVDPKDRLYDETYGAAVVRSSPEQETEEADEEEEAAAKVAAPAVPSTPAVPVLSVAPPVPVVPVAPAVPVLPVPAVTPPAPVAPAIPVITPAATVTPVVTPVTPDAVLPETAPVVASAPAATETAAAAPITPPPAASSFPSKVIFPEAAARISPAPEAITKETESVPEVAPNEPATASAPASAKVAEPFPSSVKFPEATGSPAPITPRAPITPPAPASAFPSKVVFPDVDEPAPAAAPAATTPAAEADASFFQDPTPSALVSAASITSFFADPTPSESIKLPPVESEKKQETAPQPAATDTIKKAPIPEAFPISQSAVPTTILRVKWSTAPARPGGAPATPPVGPPVAPPVAPPSAPPVSAPIPFASPAAAQSPAVVPFVQPGAAQAGNPASAFTASSAPPTAPISPAAPLPPAETGAPTRALLPSGTAPTGAPTRALLPSGTPPAQAPATGLRRLLFLPGRAVPPAADSSNDQNS